MNRGLGMEINRDNSLISKEKIIESILQEIQKNYNITEQEIINTIKQKQEQDKETIPAEILKNKKLSSLETIVKYLRENKKLSYKEIGQKLNRDPKSLAATYHVANKKQKTKIQTEIKNNTNKIPFSAFKQKLSILEAICTHLKKQGLKYSQIAELLGKDQRTIWTVCSRAQKKLGGEPQ